jgi:hypothetical protein
VLRIKGCDQQYVNLHVTVPPGLLVAADEVIEQAWIFLRCVRSLV